MKKTISQLESEMADTRDKLAKREEAYTVAILKRN